MLRRIWILTMRGGLVGSYESKTEKLRLNEVSWIRLT